MSWTPTRLNIGGDFERLTHYQFRYPAKFHPPVVRALLERYTEPNQLVLDPFCGSGTLLVEAATMGRRSIGVDIDPVAVMVSAAKIHRYSAHHLRRLQSALLGSVAQYRRADEEYERRKFIDLTEAEYALEIADIEGAIPAIPNLMHWFRRYVIVDLARIRLAIDKLPASPEHRLFLQLVFASILRNCSNADPVPVSGLEVTSYMRKRDAEGRLVDPFRALERALARAIDAAVSFERASSKQATARALLGDATRLESIVKARPDAVVTSPPYHGAVDYYRRHQLEMFWLGLTATQADRLRLLDRYIGRPWVPTRHEWVVAGVPPTKLAKEWEQKIRDVHPKRADSFRHYIVSMTESFRCMAAMLGADAPAVLVVGHSAWNATEIPTTCLFREIAGDDFRLEEVLWYPVKNRYMSYTRHNKANIRRENVLVFRRTASPCSPDQAVGKHG